MEKITTIKISESTKIELNKLKIIPEETYNNLIIRLCKGVKNEKNNINNSADNTNISS